MIAEFGTPFPHDHVPVDDPVHDLDGDGRLDTAVSDGSVYASVTGGVLDGPAVELVSDLDGDGYADHLTVIDEDGEFSAWELTSEPDGHWIRTDAGAL